MKRREQALLLLRNAGQDEALLDEVIDSRNVDDEVVGFHSQQGLEAFTPFAVAFRYEDYEPELPLDRDQARTQLRALRNWVEAKLQERLP